MAALVAVLACLCAGSAAYCLLVIVATWRYLRQPVPHTGASALPPISVFKPLAGLDEGLEENLRSFFRQDYPCFEILGAVREPADPAACVFRRLQAEHPGVASRLIVTGEPPWPNAKVFSLEQMARQARFDLWVISDSDIRAHPGFLRQLAAEFQDSRLAATTVPYRAVPGPSLWSTLEALGMNTHFWAGVLVAWLVEGMKFTVGPTSAVRRQLMEALGGFQALGDYLAEDFVLGKQAAERGFGVGLSRCVVEHHIGAQPFLANWRHRLRWARSTRRSRPAGYWGAIFTHPVPWSLLLLVVAPSWWPLAAMTLALRGLAAAAVAGQLLRDPLFARRGYLLWLEDLLNFGCWMAGFFGSRIDWRGRRYRLLADGRFELVGPAGAGRARPPA